MPMAGDIEENNAVMNSISAEFQRQPVFSGIFRRRSYPPALR